ncbi:MAG TPA: MmcQ/YjbR family DNA-binding protein [Thermoanaerobaculia bacterium]|nr:MmcQ/YjbR family DNA-binding protein [Thermoanaerobaculia bacterium]
MTSRRNKSTSMAIPLSAREVRRIVLSFPGIEEGTTYGTPSFRVKGRFLARIDEKEEALILKVDFDRRDALLEEDPETFYITDHYVGYPMVLIRLATVQPRTLRGLIEDEWRRLSSHRTVAAYDKHMSEIRRR